MLHVFPYSFLYKKHTDYQLQHLSSCVPYCKKLDDSHTFTVQCQIHSKLYSSFDTSVLNLWSPSRHPEEPALVQASEQPEVVLRWQPGLGHHYQLQLATEVAEYHVFPTSFPSFPLCTDPPQRLSAQLWHFGECFQACHPSRFDWVCSCALCVDCDCSMQLWNNPIYFGFQAGMSCAVKTYGCGHLDPKLGLPQKSKRDCRNCGWPGWTHLSKDVQPAGYEPICQWCGYHDPVHLTKSLAVQPKCFHLHNLTSLLMGLHIDKWLWQNVKAQL